MRNHYPRQISKISKTNNDRLRESNVPPEIMPKHAWKYCKLTKLRCAIISQSFLEKKGRQKRNYSISQIHQEEKTIYAWNSFKKQTFAQKLNDKT